LADLGAKLLRRVHGSILSRVGASTNPGAVHLVGALLLEQTDEWTIQRRYLTLETMASVGDTALASVSAVAR
ncbi:hypothetical protein EV148_11720, partial [Dokdonella fugitiva]